MIKAAQKMAEELAETKLRLAGLEAVALKYKKRARTRLKALKSAEQAAEETENTLREVIRDRELRVRHRTEERDELLKKFERAEANGRDAIAKVPRLEQRIRELEQALQLHAHDAIIERARELGLNAVFEKAGLSRLTQDALKGRAFMLIIANKLGIVGVHQSRVLDDVLNDIMKRIDDLLDVDAQLDEEATKNEVQHHVANR